jgi:tetratricopeptide (TPR) repeat protein
MGEVTDFGLNETLATKSLLGGFEQDLRNLITEYLWGDKSVEEDLSKYALETRIDEPDASPIDYLFLGEALNILNKHESKLPDDVRADLKSLVRNPENESRIHKIRKRDGHHRETTAVREGDLQAIFQMLRLLKAPDFRKTLARIRMVENGTLADSLSDIFQDGPVCLNNLPAKDYEATTLVGRKQDVDYVTDELLSPYNPVVSIIAPGGLGKTALALEIAWQFVGRSEFELILWHSAKTDYWTVQGSIHDDQVETDLSKAVASLGKVIDPNFAGGVEDFLQSIGEIPTLLVLDNFETFTGSDFLTLFKKFPRKSRIKVLITSRKGIGSNENRYDLRPLGVKPAVTLLQKLCRLHGVQDVLQISDTNKEVLVQDFNCKPLDLKWFVQSHAAGKTLAEIKSVKVDLLNFCVRSVMDAVSLEAKNILGCLLVSRRGLPLAEVHLMLGTELMEDLTPLVQELLRASLIERSISPLDPDIEILQLSEVTQDFLEKVSYFTPNELSALRKKRFELKDELEKRLSPDSSITAPSYVHVRNEEDEVAATFLRRALVVSRTDTKKALDMVAEARLVRRSYFEVDRVEAFILKRKDAAKAESLFEAALVEASTEIEKALVAYHFADFCTYDSDIQKAIDLSELAHENIQTSATSRQLGYFLARNGQFEEGVKLLQSASDGSSGRTRLVSLTALAKAYERWADKTYRDTHDYEDAIDLLLAGLEAAGSALTNGSSDRKAMEVYCNIVWSGLRICSHEVSRQPKRVEEMAKSLLSSPSVLVASLTGVSDDSVYKAKIRDLLKSLSSSIPNLAQQTAFIEGKIAEVSGQISAPGRLIGALRNINKERGYGFISAPNGRQFYFVRSAVSDRLEWLEFKNGLHVTFEIDPEAGSSQSPDERGNYPNAWEIVLVDQR